MNLYLNADCMNPETGLPSYPDNYFDLAIVDPPYGIGADEKNSGKTSDCHEKKSLGKINTYKTGWDATIPDETYFNELKRVSKRQIVWGANYFGLVGGMLYWHKGVTMPTYSSGELAWLSWLQKIDFVDITWHGMLQSDMKNKEQRMHPTQKPMALYRWLVKNYAKQGDKILDTHVGSASSLVVYEEMGFEYVGYELDPDYYHDSTKRLEVFRAQPKLFTGAEIFEASKPPTLF